METSERAYKREAFRSAADLGRESRHLAQAGCGKIAVIKTPEGRPERAGHLWGKAGVGECPRFDEAEVRYGPHYADGPGARGGNRETNDSDPPPMRKPPGVRRKWGSPAPRLEECYEKTERMLQAQGVSRSAADRYVSRAAVCRQAQRELDKLKRWKDKEATVIRKEMRLYKAKSKEDLVREGVEDNPGPVGLREILLLMAGVEPNPGPVQKGKDVSGKSRANLKGQGAAPSNSRRQRRRSTKRPDEQVTKALEHALVDAVANEKGKDDADEEMIREEHELRFKADSVAREEVARKVMPPVVVYHVGSERDYAALFYEVKECPQKLTPYPVPHVVAWARLVDVKEIVPEKQALFQGDQEFVGLSPHSADIRIPKGAYHVAYYHVKLVAVGWGARMSFYQVEDEATTSEEPEEVFENVICVKEMVIPVSVEQFMRAKRARVARFSLLNSYVSVRNFCSAVCNFKLDEYDAYSDTESHDQLMTALLLVQDVDSAGVDKYWKEAVANMLSWHIARNACWSAQPLVEGTYVSGYQTEMRDFFASSLATVAERVQAGKETLAQGVEELQGMLGVVRHGVQKVRDDIHAWRKGLCSARMNGTYVRGLYASFPTRVDPKNQIIGTMKRLCVQKGPCSEEMQARQAGIAAALCDFVRTRITQCACKTGVPTDDDYDAYFAAYSPENMLKRSVEKSKEYPEWSELQREQFCAGAEIAIGHAEEGRGVVAKYIGENFDTVKVMDKVETYDVQEIKASRKIVCPDHFWRGYTYAICQPSCEVWDRVMKGHNVKGMTLDELTKEMARTFPEVGRFIVGDYKNFESLVDGNVQRRCELPVLVQCAPAWPEAVAEVIEHFSHVEFHYQSTSNSGTLPSMRLSGSIVTSDGNAIANTCMSFAVISACEHVKLEDTMDWFRETYLSGIPQRGWYIEGDDSIIQVSPQVEESEMCKKHEESGNRFVYAEVDNWQEGNFCQREVVSSDAGGGGVRDVFRCPLALISKLFTLNDPDMCTCKHDEEKTVAKGMSYYLHYSGVPIFGPLCAAYLERHKSTVDKILSRVDEMREAARKGVVYSGRVRDLGVAGALWLKNSWTAKTDFFDAYRSDLAVRLHRAVEISDRMRERVRQGWTRMTAATQKAIEEDLVSQIRNGRRVLVNGTLEALWQGTESMKRTVVTEFAGQREQGRRCSDQILARGIAAAGELRSAADEVKSIPLLKLTSLSRLLIMLSSVVLAAAPFVAAVVGFWVGHAALMGLFLAIPVLLTVWWISVAITTLIYWGMFRVSFRSAVQFSMWTNLAIVWVPFIRYKMWRWFVATPSPSDIRGRLDTMMQDMSRTAAARLSAEDDRAIERLLGGSTGEEGGCEPARAEAPKPVKRMTASSLLRGLFQGSSKKQ